ncbi:MAG: flippase-like domain-containing protein [Planctomycetota bacterium]|nr:MAG: flippase-like domain-containing protein [Planctomycetota bacterium]
MKLAIRLSLSLAIAVVLIVLLMAWGDVGLGAVWNTLKSLDPAVYWTSLLVQAGIYLARAFRFRMLIPDARRPSFGRILPLTAAHSLAAYVFPAKMGEASFVLYLRRVCAIPGAHGLAVLAVSRVLDLAVVAGSLSAVCLLLGALGAAPHSLWLVQIGAALFVLTCGFAWLAANGDRLVTLVTGTARLLRLEPTRLGRTIAGAAERVRAALREVGRGRFWLGAALSLPVWLLVYLFYAILARGFGLAGLTFAEAIFGSSLAVLSNLLPINGFAGFGTQDAGWVFGFTFLGVDQKLALESALAFHLVYVFNIAVFGLFGQVAMGLHTVSHTPSLPSD